MRFLGEVTFRESGIEEIPDGTVFEQKVDFRECKNLTKIGKGVRFLGEVDFQYSGITLRPEGVVFL